MSKWKKCEKKQEYLKTSTSPESEDLSMLHSNCISISNSEKKKNVCNIEWTSAVMLRPNIMKELRGNCRVNRTELKQGFSEVT